MSCTARAHICITPIIQPRIAVDLGVRTILLPKKTRHSTDAMENLYISTAHGLSVVSACLPATKPQPQMIATVNNIMFAVSSLLRAILRHTSPFFFVCLNYTPSLPATQCCSFFFNNCQNATNSLILLHPYTIPREKCNQCIKFSTFLHLIQVNVAFSAIPAEFLQHPPKSQLTLHAGMNPPPCSHKKPKKSPPQMRR